MSKYEAGQPVVVTSDFRGVFFGYIKDASNLPAEITLTNAKCALYWSRAVGGFLGLASDGPDKDCKISKEAPEFHFYKVTGILPATDKAEKAWRAA